MEHLLDPMTLVGEASESVESGDVADNCVEFGSVVRLLDNVVGTHLEGLDTHFDVGNPGDHDDRELLDVASSPNSVNEGPAIEASISDINDEDIWWLFEDFGKAALGIGFDFDIDIIEVQVLPDN
ncbi:MAG: hypothetical protein R2688_02110 [Fimbriimonadaceae bacterium]